MTAMLTLMMLLPGAGSGSDAEKVTALVVMGMTGLKRVVTTVIAVTLVCYILRFQRALREGLHVACWNHHLHAGIIWAWDQ